jgi:proliferating cell nuclear antigen
MKLTLAEPRLLVDSVGIISELVNDVRFKIDSNQIELIAMDPANVAMIIFKLLCSAFSEYKVEKPVTLAVSLESLKAILKRVKPADVLSMELDSEKNRLKVTLKSDGTRTFNLALIDVEDKEQRIPDLNFPIKVEMNSMALDDAVYDMDVVAESIALSAQKGKFVVEAESNMNDAHSEIVEDDQTKITGAKSEVRSKYSIEYLKKIIKGGKIAPRVVLQFNKDYPLRVDYLVKDKLSFSVILAPRVSND